MSDEQVSMVQKIEAKTLKVFAMLEKYPIYEYLVEENANILCVGSFDALYPYIAGIAAIGQMLDVKLKFHIVQAEFDFRNRLMKAAPMLDKFSNLSKEQVNSEELYAEFFFYKKIAAVKEICRYAIVAFKGEETQLNAVQEVAANAAFIKEKVCIHYTGAKQNESGVTANVTFNRLDKLNPKESFLVSLGERAFRLHYLYMREGNPQCGYNKCRNDFAEDGYSQTSSAASALHCGYKLFSIGINPRSKKEIVIKEYARKVLGEDKTLWNALLYLEHRRWLMYTIFLGYRMPTMEEINRYAFMEGNYRWRSDALKLHNCLVPSRKSGMMLSGISKQQWETPLNDIELDALDRMSLELHQLAGRKKDIARKAVEGELRTIRSLLIQGEDGIAEKDQKILDVFRDRIDDLFNGKNLKLAEACFKEIEQCMTEYALPRNNLNNIRIHLKIVFEYYSYRDFKASDQVMVDDLLYMLYAPFNTVLIKPISEKVIENIASPLIIEPEKVVYVTEQVQAIDNYEEFFRGRGRGTAVEAAVADGGNIAVIKRAFKKIIDQYNGKPCVVDITGASSMFAGAAMQLAQENPRIGVICADAVKQQIINIYNFTKAPVYRQRQTVSTHEAYGLFGAKRKESISGDSAVVLELQKLIPKAWDFYRNKINRKEYEVLCRFLTYYIDRSGIVSWESLGENLILGREEVFEKNVAEAYVDATGLKKVLVELQEKKIIKELSIKKGNFGTVEVQFKLPSSFKKKMNSLFNELQGSKQYEVFTFDAKKSEVPIRYVGVRERKNEIFRVAVADTFYCGDRVYSLSTHIMPWLQGMRECGLLANNPSRSEGILNFRFNSMSTQIAKSIFVKSGNIMELYTWLAAISEDIFDEAYPNFGFEWADGAVSNELDLILVKGLQTGAVSCKTGAYKREDVYEVWYLARKFSLNSRAAIIYLEASGISVTERTRVQKMGVELIVIGELENEAKQILGEDAQPKSINQLTMKLLAKALQRLFE